MSTNSVPFPPAFAFSQTSLQDFVDCARRFQLRYVQQQEWPAPVVEPIGDYERAEALGKQFHLLVQRHYLDLPITQVDPALGQWWDAFLTYPPILPGTIRRPELHTTATILGQRVTAAFDLLAYEPGGQAVIVDWKTTRAGPSREWLDRRLQTILYPLLLVESAEPLIGKPVAPDDVTLMYWFTAAPDQPMLFRYDQARYEADKAYLKTLFEQIFSMDSAQWPLTDVIRRCAFCQYRSLCDRGSTAGSLDEAEGEPPPATEMLPDESYVL